MYQQDKIVGLLDAYSPPQIARLIEEVGVRKARSPVLQTVALSLLGGAFIAFGAMFYTLTVTGSTLGFGPSRLLGGVAFSLGLILVLIGGAELFTGNNLLAMGWADRKVTTVEVLRNWGLVYLGNFIGAMGCVALVHFSGMLSLENGAIAETSLKIASAKVRLDFGEAFFRGILCNSLVCLAVWLSMASHDVMSKILAIVFPIAAFVALGFEHSVANMYSIPLAMLDPRSTITLSDFFANLLPVTLGNIVGGSVFVALIYWIIYLRGEGKGTSPGV